MRHLQIRFVHEIRPGYHTFMTEGKEKGDELVSERARDDSGGDQPAGGERGAAVGDRLLVVGAWPTMVRNARREGYWTSNTSSQCSPSGPITVCFRLPRHSTLAATSPSIGSTRAP
jgi:hypothetical protein